MQQRFSSAAPWPRFVTMTLAIVLGLVGVGGPRPTAQQPTNGSQKKVRLNRVIEQLELGRPVVGPIVLNGSLADARALATSDIDFALIDMEHGPYDIAALQLTLLGMTDKATIVRTGNLRPNVVPTVRIPMHGYEDPIYTVKQLLDIGVFGIMFPRVSTKAEALTAVKAMRYPQRKDSKYPEPLGERGFSPSAAVWYWGLSSSAEYLQRADVWPLNPDGELFAFLQIETPEGVKNINEIMQVPGIGSIVIGTSDLGNAIGEGPGSPPQPRTEALVQTVLKACLAKNIPCGIVAGNVADVTRRLKEGFKVLFVPATEQSAALRAARELSK